MGTYEEGLTVALTHGKLFVRRPPGVSADELVPLPDGRFAIAGDAMGMQMRFTFDAGTPSPRLTVDRPDGTRRTFARKSRGAE